jgi:tetratricopeptide (TPR) repeat protein
MKKNFLLLFIFISTISYSQGDKSEAEKKFKEAQALTDQKKYKEAIKMFEEVQKMEPESSLPQYEIALVYCKSQEFEKCIEILEKIKNKKDAEDIYYSLLGNAYDFNDDRDKAIETYNAGLKKFPNSGPIYLELGVIQLMEKEYDKALKYFEKGIEVDPMHPSNYYWATIIWSTTKDKVWALIYGEIFLNLEKNSNRTQVISKLMFEIYQKGFEFGKNTILTHLANTDVVSSSKEEAEKLINSFKVQGYEVLMGLAAVGQNKIDINSLNKIRTGYLELYYKEGFDKKFPVVIFDYQKKLEEAGYLEAYNYWILLDGDKQNESEREGKNRDTWDNFLTWFDKNPMVINESNKFVRTKINK